MSHTFKIVTLSVLLAYVALLSIYLIWKGLEYFEQPMIQASQLRPLDGKTVYRIVITEDERGPVYAVVKEGEPDSAADLAWRRVGRSAVNLTERLNQPVRIQGRYYMGVPLSAILSQDEFEPVPLVQEQVVIDIQHVRDAR